MPKKPKFHDDFIESEVIDREWELPDFSDAMVVPRNYSIIIVNKDTGECDEFDVTERQADTIRDSIT